MSDWEEKLCKCSVSVICGGKLSYWDRRGVVVGRRGWVG